MGKLVKIVANALVIVAVVIVGWQAYTLFRGFNAPTKVVEVGPAILEQVRHVNKQIFVEHYTSIDITYTEIPAGWMGPLQHLGIKQGMTMLIRGRVPAGLDLTEMSEGDIWVSTDRRRVQVTLPAPQVFVENVSIDLEHSRILAQSDFCPGFLCPTTDLEAYKNDIEPEARRRLISTAQEQEILQQAATSAQVYYESLLNSLGIAEVRVVVKGYSS